MKDCSCSIVVPVFNEAARLPLSGFETALNELVQLRLIFVDDGSADDSRRLLQQLAEQFPDRVTLLRNDKNSGKAESVRRGLLHAQQSGAGFFGYWDADLSTSLIEVPRFCQVLAEQPETLAVYGSRLKLLGRRVERSWLRHYLGRVYATLISITLNLGVYDSQCGAKMFRAAPVMESVLQKPFATRWLFDVEILARLIVAARKNPAFHPDHSVVELPLASWIDVPGSKVRLRDGFIALWQLLGIRRSLRS